MNGEKHNIHSKMKINKINIIFSIQTTDHKTSGYFIQFIEDVRMLYGAN